MHAMNLLPSLYTPELNPPTADHVSNSVGQERFADQKLTIGERVAEKTRIAKEMAKHALIAVGLRIPDISKKVISSDYGKKIINMAQTATKETAMAAAKNGLMTLNELYGVGFEDGHVTVESKRQLAEGAFRLLRMPQVEAVGALKAAGHGMYKAGRQEAVSQMHSARETLAADVRNATQSVTTVYSSFNTPR